MKALLEQLPSPYNEKALSQFDQEFFDKRSSPTAFINTPRDVLAVAFDWENSEEGYEYWYNVYKNL